MTKGKEKGKCTDQENETGKRRKEPKEGKKVQKKRENFISA